MYNNNMNSQSVRSASSHVSFYPTSEEENLYNKHMFANSGTPTNIEEGIYFKYSENGEEKYGYETTYDGKRSPYTRTNGPFTTYTPTKENSTTQPIPTPFPQYSYENPNSYDNQNSWNPNHTTLLPRTYKPEPEPQVPSPIEPPSESNPEMCIRLMKSQIIDVDSSVGQCRNQFDREMEGTMDIIFRSCTQSHFKDAQFASLKTFTPNDPSYTIVDHLQAVMSFAKNKLGGPHGNSGWSSLLLFLHNGTNTSDAVKSRCQTLKKLKMEGTQTFNGNVTEQDAAMQVYQYCLLLFYTFKLSSESDTSMYHLKLTHAIGHSTLSFAEGTNLWEKILSAGQKNGSTARILQSTMFDAIMKDNGQEGREIKNRFQSTIKLKSLSREFASWERDDTTYILLLDASVRELAKEDAVNLHMTSKPSATGNRRNPINVNNTSMFSNQLDVANISKLSPMRTV
jgi:hypothetical protein